MCVPPTAYANGSALVFYNSTTYRDDMVWAAAWLYKATGDRVSHPADTIHLECWPPLSGLTLFGDLRIGKHNGNILPASANSGLDNWSAELHHM